MADPKPTGITAKSTLGDLLAGMGIDLTNIPKPGSGTKAKKSGTYVRTQISAQAPTDQAIRQTINKVFKAYYGRDARADELATWAPQLKAKYVGKNGNSKTTIKETSKHGNLVSTEYLTADSIDPGVWLDEQIKANGSSAAWASPS